MGTIRVAVVNDFELVVRGVAALLGAEPGIEVVELEVEGPVTTPVDVALYDTFGASRLERRLLTDVIDHPRIGAVVAYTSRTDPALVDFFIGAGGRGFVSKACSGAELADVIRRVHDGEVVIRDAELPEDDERDVPGEWPGRSFGLSEREADTLALVAAGLENEDIADQLYVSVNTVKARLKSIYRKIDVDNRVRAAMWASHHGFQADRHTDWKITAD